MRLLKLDSKIDQEQSLIFGRDICEGLFFVYQYDMSIMIFHFYIRYGSVGGGLCFLEKYIRSESQSPAKIMVFHTTHRSIPAE